MPTQPVPPDLPVATESGGGQPPHDNLPAGVSSGPPMPPNEERVMTVGEHFEDLRKAIIRSLYGLGVAIIAVFVFATDIHQLLSTPYKVQIGKGRTAVAVTDGKGRKLMANLESYYREVRYIAPEDVENYFNTETGATILDGILDPGSSDGADLVVLDLPGIPLEWQRPWLAGTLDNFPAQKIMVLGQFKQTSEKEPANAALYREFFERGPPVYMLESPVFEYEFKRVVEDNFRRNIGREPGGRFIQLRPGELFSVYIKLAIMISILTMFPWLLWQAWWFVAPAFEAPVRRIGYGVIFVSTFLFWGGILLAWTKVFPQGLYYLVVMFNFENTAAQFSISDYYSFFFGFHFAFGIAFQLPIIIVALGRMGIVTSGFLWRVRGTVMIVLAISSALLTPPDVLSQIMLLVPLSMLYFLSTGIVWMFERRRKKG